jgi:hypothetical protein
MLAIQHSAWFLCVIQIAQWDAGGSRVTRDTRPLFRLTEDSLTSTGSLTGTQITRMISRRLAMGAAHACRLR